MIFNQEIAIEKRGRKNVQPLNLEFRSLADSSPVPIWISGPDMGCTFFNRQWLDFTGVPMEQQLGEGWHQLVHPVDRDGLLRAYRSAFEQKREFDLEYRLRYKDGAYRWIRSRGQPRLDSHNHMSGFIGSAWDLSDQKKASESANKAIRYVHLVKDVATVANSATTMRDALQRSLDVICETMRFSVGYAFLIHDDEPSSAKPWHVMHTTDQARFAALIEMSNSVDWKRAEVSHSGKPVVLDMIECSRALEPCPRLNAALSAGLRGTVHVPILVEHKMEAILEFASEQPMPADQEFMDALLAASERLSRFFERRRAQIAFLRQQEELQAFSGQLLVMAGRLVDSQEAERHRIAREIHDDFTQRLAVVSMKLSELAERDRNGASAELRTSLEDLRQSIASVADDLRDLSHDLRPATLELLGLVRSLQAQCDEFQLVRKIETIFKATASDHDASPETATCLFRVLQEGLTNIAKHSGSTTASVTLSRQGSNLEMRIRDEGKGFVSSEIHSVGIGLMNIRDRMRLLGGDLNLNSRPGSGTEVVVRVPALPRAH
jgi:PAS domain S-box-containing protein